MPFTRLDLAGALALAVATPALAQQASTPVSTIDPTHTLLTVSADGKSTRAPDLASFSAGVTSQADTASAALGANSRDMGAVVASLRRAGIAPRDIQTSNLNLEPVYAPQRRLPDGSVEDGGQKIVGYRVTDTVTVRQRDLAQYGRVIDTLVSAGANQVNGPNFMLDQPDAASDEARTQAVAKARQRAELYARAAGLHVVRIVSIAENGGYSPPSPVMFRRMAAEAMPAPPIEAGELDVGASVTVQFELAQ